MLKTLLQFLLARFSRARNQRRVERALAEGIARIASGDNAAARRFLEQALAMDPRNAAAFFQLGVLAARTEPYPESAGNFARALELEPRHAEWWTVLGELAQRHADHAKAGEYFQVALSIEDSAQAHRGLGRALRHAGRAGEAIIHLRRSHALAPASPGVLRDFVGALIEYDMCDKALAIASQAAASDPMSYEANFCLGLAHQKLHDPQQALACYEAAGRMRSDDADLHDARGSTLQELGRLDEALAEYDRALALHPNHASALFHRALAYLLKQDFVRGWPDYELRRAGSGRVPYTAVAARWDGADPAGRTILIRREQGLGDEIMFASVLPELMRKAGHCMVECDPRLRSLFARSFPAATVFGSIPDRALPYPVARRSIDFETDMGSLPLILRRSAADFPRHQGYLRADPARVAHWRERLAQLGSGLKVGLSWTGGVRKTRRALRSIGLEELLPVLSVPGVRYVSLQYTAAAAAETSAMEARHGIRIEHWPDAIENYDETAALVSALDIVVSVCTSVVHLAGALGRPVWVMAPCGPEWRYGLSGETMPWYPTAKVYRSPAYRDWQPAVAAVAQDLRRTAS